MLNKLTNKIIIILILSDICIDLNSAALETKLEPIKSKSKKYEIKTKKELKTAEKLKELDIVLPDLSSIIAQYTAPARVNLFFSPDLIGDVRARYDKEVKNGKEIEKMISKYPKMKKKCLLDTEIREYGFYNEKKEIISMVKFGDYDIKTLSIPTKKFMASINKKGILTKIFINLKIVSAETKKEQKYIFEINKSLFENKPGPYNYYISLISDKSECSGENETIISSFMPNDSKKICVKQIMD